MKTFPEHGATHPLESAREPLMKHVALETYLPEIERKPSRLQKICKSKMQRSFVAVHYRHLYRFARRRRVAPVGGIMQTGTQY